MSIQESQEFVNSVRKIAQEVVSVSSMIQWGTVVSTVAKPNGAFLFDVSLISDPSVVLSNVSNQSDYDLKVGDSVALFLINGDLNNAYIVGKRGASSAESSVQAEPIPVPTQVPPALIEPEVLFSVECDGTPTFVKESGRFVCYVPVLLGTTQLTAWWDLGQPFDGYVYSSQLSAISEQCGILSDYHYAPIGLSANRTVKYWWGQTAKELSVLASSFLVECWQRSEQDPLLCAPTLQNNKALFRVRSQSRTISGTRNDNAQNVTVTASLQIIDVSLLEPDKLIAPTLALSGNTLSLTVTDGRADQFFLRSTQSSSALTLIGRHPVGQTTEFDMSSLGLAQTTTVYVYAQSTAGVYAQSTSSNSITYTPPVTPTLAAPTIALRSGQYLDITDQDGNAERFTVSAHPQGQSSPVSTITIVKNGTITTFNLAGWSSLQPFTTYMVKARALANGYNSSEYSAEIQYEA